MARALSPSLDAIMRSRSRQPGYRVDVYDLRSTAAEVAPTRINQVVLANVGVGAVPAIVGPRDFTDEVVRAELLETVGDFVQGGVASTQLQLEVVDPRGTLDPLENPPTLADPEASGRWLRQGNVIVVREGDLRVPLEEWVYTFTGEIVGQVGAHRNRTTGESRLLVRAVSREAAFLRLLSTSADFQQGTSFGDVAQSLAEVDLGLEPDEVALPAFSVRTTAHAHTQFVDECPLVSLAKLLFPDGFMPRFDGLGRLGAASVAITKGAVRSFEQREALIALERPLIEDTGTNQVEVVGLSGEQRKVVQGRQTLATASITTGFFSKDATIPVRWSDDGTLQAQELRFEVDSSVGDGIFGFGDEDFTPGTPGADGGYTRGEIEVEGGLESSLVLAGLVAGAWLIAHAKVDGVVAFGTGTVSGYTIPLGRIIEGAIGQTLFTILGRIGRGQYRITGRPYEWVFDELEGRARVSGLLEQDVRSVRIENHLINDQASCDAIALRTLRRVRKQLNARSIRMVHDLALEPEDVFGVGVGADRRLYLITAIRRTLQRSGRLEASIEAFEVTGGVRP